MSVSNGIVWGGPFCHYEGSDGVVGTAPSGNHRLPTWQGHTPTRYF